MHILIVEDNQADRELLLEALQERFMKEAKFRVAMDLRSAFEYLDRVLDGEPFFNVVILDLGLPDSSGRDTFRAIHDKYPQVPIVVMSNNTDMDLALDLIREGAADFILKDYSNTITIFRRVVFAATRQKMSIRPPA